MKKPFHLLVLLCMAIFYGCSPVVETSEEFAEKSEFDIDKSIRYLDKIIDHDGNNSDALFQRAKLELQVSRTLRAKEDILTALSLEKNNTDYLILKAKIDAAIGQNNDAVNSIETILKNGDKLSTVEDQIFATNLYLGFNNLNKAEYFLQQAAQEAPELPEVLYNRARLYTIRHDTARAVSFYKHILSRDSTHKGSLTDLAEIYMFRHMPDTALRFLSRVSDASSLKYNELYARLLTDKGLTDSASRFWGQALLLSPRDPVAHFELGKYYFNRKLYQNASAHFAAVTENERRKFRNFYLMYAQTSEQLADSAKAADLYLKSKMYDTTAVSPHVHKKHHKTENQ